MLLQTHGIFGSVDGVPLPDFISTWDTALTSAGSSSDVQVQLPLIASGVYNFDVAWGDGNNDTITVWNQAQTLHTYASTGIYTITISGTCTGWQYATQTLSDDEKIIDISSWGILKPGVTQAFSGCRNLGILTATDELNVTGLTDLFSTFTSNLKLNNLITTNWNLSSATDMRSVFTQCTKLTALDVSNWDVSGVTTMSGLFDICTLVVALDVSNWDVSSVVNLSGTFSDCSTLTSLDVSSWDTSSVEIMLGTFQSCNNLTLLNLSAFDTSSVSRMDDMFNGCTSLTAIQAGGWDVSSVTDFTDFAKGVTLTTVEYDAILNNTTGWISRGVLANKTISFGGSKYTNSGDALLGRQNLINTHGWTITDGGPV